MYTGVVQTSTLIINQGRDVELAHADLVRAQALEPGNADIRAALRRVRKRLDALEVRDKAAFRGLF